MRLYVTFLIFLFFFIQLKGMESDELGEIYSSSMIASSIELSFYEELYDAMVNKFNIEGSSAAVLGDFIIPIEDFITENIRKDPLKVFDEKKFKKFLLTNSAELLEILGLWEVSQEDFKLVIKEFFSKKKPKKRFGICCKLGTVFCAIVFVISVIYFVFWALNKLEDYCDFSIDINFPNMPSPTNIPSPIIMPSPTSIPDIPGT